VSVARIASYRIYLQEPFQYVNDFAWDYASAKEWLDGGDPYADLRELTRRHVSEIEGFGGTYIVQNPHPPAGILVYAPFALVHAGPARTLWFAISVAALLGSLWIVARALSFDRVTAAVIALAGLALPITGSDLRWGQINSILLFALAWTWKDLRSGRDARAGSILGLVAALKLFPAFMLIPLIRMRRTKAVTWLVGTAIGVSAASVLLVGFSSIGKFISASRLNFNAWADTPYNLSLVGTPYRLSAPRLGPDQVNVLPAFVPVVACFIFAACVLAGIRTDGALSGDRYWAAVPWLILASPLVWEHYLVLVIPVGILAMRRLASTHWMIRLAAVASFGVVTLGNRVVDALALVLRSSRSNVTLVLLGTCLLTGALLAFALVDGVGRLHSDRRDGSI
jgi:alpha-1,2-mannosyltransferase